MKAKKVMVTVLAAAALVTASVFGTMAYLTDNESVTNTFTVGKVGLTLDETDVDENGVKESDTRVKENTYHLIPGQTYMKDPTIKMDADSEDSYVFVTVKNNIAAIEWDSDDTHKTIAEQMAELKWDVLKDESGADVKLGDLFVYVHKGSTEGVPNVVKATEPSELPVFLEFTIDGVDVGNSNAVGEKQLADYETTAQNGTAVEVTAYAVQAAGFDSAYDAWTAGGF